MPGRLISGKARQGFRHQNWYMAMKVSGWSLLEAMPVIEIDHIGVVGKCVEIGVLQWEQILLETEEREAEGFQHVIDLGQGEAVFLDMKKQVHGTCLC